MKLSDILVFCCLFVVSSSLDTDQVNQIKSIEKKTKLKKTEKLKPIKRVTSTESSSTLAEAKIEEVVASSSPDIASASLQTTSTPQTTATTSKEYWPKTQDGPRNQNVRSRLRQHLLMHYDRNVHPVVNWKDAVQVAGTTSDMRVMFKGVWNVWFGYDNYHNLSLNACL